MLKVYYNRALTEYDGIIAELRAEGCQISYTDTEEHDLGFSDCRTHAKRTINCGFRFPDFAIEVMDFKLRKGPALFYLTKWWEADYGWGDETAIVLPVSGLMAHDLGPQVTVGCGLRFVSTESVELFKNQKLMEVLMGFRTSGFISLGFNNIGELCSIETGIPAYGIYGIFECVKVSLSSFFVQPTAFMQCWAVANLVSRVPFPAPLAEPYKIDMPTTAEKHFWKWGDIRSSRIGVATAWSVMPEAALGTATGIVMHTCAHLKAPEVQYRTDIAMPIGNAWVKAKKLLGI